MASKASNNSDKKPTQLKAADLTTSAGNKFGPATARIHSPLPEEHPLYASIGRVASEFAQFEHVLDLTIWDMSVLEQSLGACITAQLNGATPRFKAILALGTRRCIKKALIKRMETLMRRTYDVAEQRHRIVHDHGISKTPQAS